MHVNEFVGQVQQGKRLPDIERALNKPRRTVTKLSEGTWQNSDGREAVSKTARSPRRFGAGF